MVGSYYAKIKGHNNTSVQYKLKLQHNSFSLNFKGQITILNALVVG